MERIAKSATTKNPPERFTGDVWLDSIVGPRDADQRTTAALVRFAPGARTAWHSHARGQTLHIVSGVALLGSRDGAVIRALPGETIYTPPGEEHWHGATADDFMEHLAILEGDDGAPVPSVWAEHVTDGDYVRANEL